MNRCHIDDAAADRLLSGRLAPEDAPPGYAGVAALARTATGPATPVELAREPSDVAAALAAVASAPVPISALARRRSMIGKLLTAKVAVGATIVALGAGSAAAALSGGLPAQATSHANAHAKAGLATAASHVGTAGHSSSTHQASSPQSGSSRTSTAPSSVQSTGIANSHAMFGLCTAFLAGGSTSASGKDASAAFEALIAETGGSPSATTSFCKGFVMSNHPGGKPSPPVGSPAGKPSSAGESSHAKVATPNSGGTGTADQASGGASSGGTTTAGQASGGASSAGSANAGNR